MPTVAAASLPAAFVAPVLDQLEFWNTSTKHDSPLQYSPILSPGVPARGGKTPCLRNCGAPKLIEFAPAGWSSTIPRLKGWGSGESATGRGRAGATWLRPAGAGRWLAE